MKPLAHLLGSRLGLRPLGAAIVLGSVGPVEVFFPPSPPPLGAARPFAPAGRSGAPAALAAYVTEPFYAPLSTRLIRNEIGDDLAFRLAGYRSSREALRAELQARLYTLRGLDPPSRERALRRFSAEQTPRIAALESEAEALRERMARHGSGLAEYRRWAEGGAEMNGSPADERRGILMAEFYAEGLSPAQRRLLAGIALWLAEGKGPWIPFLPETSRIAPPARLPAGLDRAISDYESARAGLETRLLLALFPPKPYRSELAREIELRLLATAQSPQFAVLEGKAEEVRRRWAALGDPSGPPGTSDLPPALAAEIAEYRRRKLLLNRELLARRDEVIRANPAAGTAVLAERIRRAISEFSASNAGGYAELDRRRDEIRSELARLPRPSAGPAGSLLDSFSSSLRELESYWDFRDYRAAVLQPGLSPEQRRLLFGEAVEALQLPLPENEFARPGGPP